MPSPRRPPVPRRRSATTPRARAEPTHEALALDPVAGDRGRAGGLRLALGGGRSGLRAAAPARLAGGDHGGRRRRDPAAGVGPADPGLAIAALAVRSALAAASTAQPAASGRRPDRPGRRSSR